MCESDFCNCEEDMIIQERYASLNIMRAIRGVFDDRRKT